MNDPRAGGPISTLTETFRGIGAGPTIILATLVVAALVAAAFPVGGDLVGPLGSLLGFTAASVTILRRTASFDDRERLGWRLIGGGFGLATMGMVTVVVLEIVSPPIPAFGFPDVFFLASYVTILTGFAFLPHQSSSALQRVRVYLDSAIGALSVGAVMWVLVLDDLVHSFAGGSAWERWAGTAYPVLDVAALIVVVIVVSRRSAFRFDPRLLLFAAGVVIQAYADIKYLQAGVGRSFGEVQPNFAAFTLAGSLYYAAAAISDRVPRIRSYADRPASAWSMIAPYGAAAALVGLVLSEIRLSQIDAAGRLALVVTIVVGVLVVVRQSVAIHENRRLLDRQRSDLVGSISHELRTPLTAIVGFLEELVSSDAVTEAERHELLAITAKEARYLQHLVEDLAPLRSGGGQDLTLEEVWMDVGEIVSRAVNSTGATAVVHSLEPGLEVFADPMRIQQVLVNLIQNTQRYGGSHSEIVGARRGGDVVIEVHDDGPGVPKQWELAIWDRFERGVNRYDASRPGSGIGLAMVAAIADAHGGRYDYRRSERLGGACFGIVLTGRAVASRHRPVAQSLER